MPRLELEWSGPDLPGVPLLALVVTTRGAAPVYAPALSQVPAEDQTALARDMVAIFRRMADGLEGSVDLAEAVDAAMVPATDPPADTPRPGGAS